MTRHFRISGRHLALWLGLLLCGLLAGGLFHPAEATQLPAGVKSYLLDKDPQVRIRFDGLVTFSNGESYLPVIPQAPQVPDARTVARVYPEGVDYPDLVQFDNNYYLLRLTHTDKGRLVLPKLPEYPLSLLEGLLPQDLVLPPNLFIPIELKVILGALPYHPEMQEAASASPARPVRPAAKPPAASPPPAAKVPPPATRPLPRTNVQEMLFVYNVNDHKLVSVDPGSKRSQGSLNLGCVPSRIRPSADGRLLFVTCLTSDELLVVDTSANLLKTRLKVGSKPDDVLLLADGGEALISHRFSKFVSRVDTARLTEPRQLALPGAGGAMTALPAQQAVLVADAFGGKVYRLNLLQHVVEKTYDTLPNVSAMAVRGNELWLTSRTANQVQVLDLESGQVLGTFPVGKKPLELLPVGDRLYALSAESAQLDVLDWKSKALLAPIQLPDGMFPAGMVLSRGESSLLYVIGAGSEGVALVSLTESRLQQRLNLPIRGTLIALAGGVLESAAEQDAEASQAAESKDREMEAVSLDAPSLQTTPPTQKNAARGSANTGTATPASLFPALPALQENVLK